MQLNLFDAGNLVKNSFREHLKAFHLTAAINDLNTMGKTLDAPAKTEEQHAALSRLLEALPAKRTEALRFLGALYVDFEQLPLAQILADNARFLKEGLSRALSERLDASDYDFIISGLHPAEIFIAVNDFAAAEQAAATYLRQVGERAFVRQLQACALYSLGKEEKALTAYTYALFNNPHRCRGSYLLPPAYYHKYEYLLRKHEKEEDALIRLPLALWQSGLTYIDAEGGRFTKLLERDIRTHDKEARRDAGENILQFNRLLYLAESERLRLGRHNTSEKLRDLQLTMQNLNGELFTMYINVLKSFRNL